MKKLRRTLNDQVKKLNDDVYRLRENEFLLKNKERALKNLGNNIERLKHKKIENCNLAIIPSNNILAELKIIYKNYLELDYRYKSPLVKEEHELNTLENRVLTDRESKQFYERWKDILENQLSLDYDVSEPDNGQNELKKTDIFDEAIKKMKTQTIVPKTNNYVNAGYSYDNLLRLLDLQLKSKVKTPETEYVQKQISQSIENRYRIKNVFTEHSQWLKNMKNQVYRNINKITPIAKSNSV